MKAITRVHTGVRLETRMLKVLQALRNVDGLDLTAEDSHRLREAERDGQALLTARHRPDRLPGYSLSHNSIPPLMLFSRTWALPPPSEPLRRSPGP